MTCSLIKLIKFKCVVFFVQNNVVGKKNYFAFLCSEELVKICHCDNNQHDFMISNHNGGPSRAGSGEAVQKEINGFKYSKGLYQLST